MVREADKVETKMFMENFFPQYKITDDPFEQFFCYAEENILGVVSFSIIYERAEINYICVKPEYRNQKIATKLLNKAVEKAVSSCCSNISLEVEETNIAAINLYEKFGFKRCAVRNKYYGKNNGFLYVRELGDING